MEWIEKALNYATLGVEIDIIKKLAIAFLFGAVLGFERSLKRKQASIKTTIVITVTSALVTIVSIEAVELYAQAYSTPMDPLRLSAQLLSGYLTIIVLNYITKKKNILPNLFLLREKGFFYFAHKYKKCVGN